MIDYRNWWTDTPPEKPLLLQKLKGNGYNTLMLVGNSLLASKPKKLSDAHLQNHFSLAFREVSLLKIGFNQEAVESFSR